MTKRLLLGRAGNERQENFCFVNVASESMYCGVSLVSIRPLVA